MDIFKAMTLDVIPMMIYAAHIRTPEEERHAAAEKFISTITPDTSDMGTIAYCLGYCHGAWSAAASVSEGWILPPEKFTELERAKVALTVARLILAEDAG